MGYRRATQITTIGLIKRPKRLFCTNCSLKLGYMKKEFWVIMDQYAMVKILFEIY